MALAAAKQVANPKGTITLYLYGGVGLGKTHLMHAGNEILNQILQKELFMFIQKNLLQTWLKPFNWVL